LHPPFFGKIYNFCIPRNYCTPPFFGHRGGGAIITWNTVIQIPFRILASWAVNTELIVLVVRKNERDFSKYYFESRQNKLFRIVMESYSNILSGKPMSDIAQMNEETCRMFDSFPAIKLEEGETLRSIQSSIYIKNIY